MKSPPEFDLRRQFNRISRRVQDHFKNYSVRFCIATCADFAAAHPNIKKILEKSDSMETLLPYAMQLVTGIDEVVKEKKIGSQKVSETAAILMVLLKW